MNNFRFINNFLHVENVSIKNLSRTFGTPFYCYSTNSIIQKYKQFEKPFLNTDIKICYAVKANPNIAILKILSKLGCGTEVVSYGELKRSLEAGISNKKIVFSGVGKTFDEIQYAIKKNILQINIESIGELELIEKIAKKSKKVIQLGIRLNPNIDANTHSKITTGILDNKFGLDEILTEKIFKKYKNNKNIKIKGLSIHIGSQITKMEPFNRAFIKVTNFVKKLNKNNIKIKYLDLGGGIGISYNNEKTVSFQTYAKTILKISKELGCEIILEPGRFLIANSGILVAKVLYIKKSKKNNFAIIDTGMNDLIRPALYDSYHEIDTVEKKRKKKIFYNVVGPICETADTFIKRKLLKKLKMNDLIFFKNVGAYGASMSSSYNSRPIIPEILVYKNKFGIIRKKENIVSQISKEKIPGWI